MNYEDDCINKDDIFKNIFFLGGFSFSFSRYLCLCLLFCFVLHFCSIKKTFFIYHSVLYLTVFIDTCSVYLISFLFAQRPLSCIYLCLLCHDRFICI